MVDKLYAILPEFKRKGDKVNKLEYDHSKLPHENNVAQRNNALLDIMWGVLTNADTAPKMLNPGGFDDQKKAARVATILHSSTKDSLEKELNEVKNEDGSKLKGKSIAEKLQNLTLKQAEKLADKVKVKLDPLSPYTHVVLHQRNVTGGALIGVYANHNANHALVQHTELALSKYGSFEFLGRTLTSLHEVTTKVGDTTQYISKNIAGFLAASVDNAKDPVLGGINQNEFTANVSMLLARQGYSTEEIGMLMTQPIILEMTKNYFKDKKEFISKNKSIQTTLSLYGGKYTNKEQPLKLTIEDLTNNILEPSGEINRAVGNIFLKMMESADTLAELVGATRCDTQGGAAGPTIADTQNNMFKLENFVKRIEDEGPKFPLIGADILNPDLTVSDLKYITDEVKIDDLRSDLYSSKLPYLQAFYTLGLKETEKMLGGQFPQFRDSFKDVVKYMISSTKYDKLDVKTINNVYNDLFAYIMSKNSFFGNETKGENVITSEEKRKDFIIKFPSHFEKIMKENPDIAELPFLKKLTVIKPSDKNENVVRTLEFKEVGSVTNQLRESYARDWTSLLRMSNPDANRLAVDLFRYCYYRNGFAFGPSTFIHFAPVALREAIPGYLDTLRSLLNTTDDYSHFINQYIRNHATNNKIVPEVKIENKKDADDFLKDRRGTFEIKVSSKDKTFKKDLIKSSKQASYEKGGQIIYYNKLTYLPNFHITDSKGEKVYYHLTNTFANTATYVEFTPLNENFIQYEYGVPASQIKNVVQKQIKIQGQGEDVYEDEDYLNSDDVIRPDIDMGDNTVYEAYKNEFNESLMDAFTEDSDSLNDYYSNDPFIDAEGIEEC